MISADAAARTIEWNFIVSGSAESYQEHEVLKVISGIGFLGSRVGQLHENDHVHRTDFHLSGAVQIGTQETLQGRCVVLGHVRWWRVTIDKEADVIAAARFVMGTPGIVVIITATEPKDLPLLDQVVRVAGAEDA